MTCHNLNKQMASLQCGSFLEPSKYHFVWMTSHILNKKRASLLCWSFHASSMNHFLWMTRHILNKWRACLHFHFHAPSIYHFLWMTCHICYKVRASLLCGSFHVPSNGHSGRNILSKMSPLMHFQITSFSEWLVTLIVDCFTFQIQTEIQISALVISGDIRISACRQPIEVYYGSF